MNGKQRSLRAASRRPPGEVSRAQQCYDRPAPAEAPMAERHVPVTYPESDGKPMAESDAHQIEMTEYAIQLLKDVFADQKKVYVAGNNFLYYTAGVPGDVVSPDCYVVKGVPKRVR